MQGHAAEGAMAKGTNAKRRGSTLPVRTISPSDLPPRDEASGLVHVLVDTPRGSPVKFKFDPEKRCYTIAHVLPPGAVFPFDFGSVPRTLAEDGDPLDMVVLIEHATFPGCLVSVRLVGVLAAKQTQNGKTMRNDRLIGAAGESRVFREVKGLRDLPGRLLEELEHFFVSYNEERGRRFRVLGGYGPRRAEAVLRAGERRFSRREDDRRGKGESRGSRRI